MRRPDCNCGSPSWRHHENFCPRVTGVEECRWCGEFHTGRCEPHTLCCDPNLAMLDHRCSNCPGVSHAA